MRCERACVCVWNFQRDFRVREVKCVPYPYPKTMFSYLFVFDLIPPFKAGEQMMVNCFRIDVFVCQQSTCSCQFTLLSIRILCFYLTLKSTAKGKTLRLFEIHVFISIFIVSVLFLIHSKISNAMMFIIKDFACTQPSNKQRNESQRNGKNEKKKN